MALKPRVFVFNGERLADPDPGLTPQQVKDHYAARYPQLTNATFKFSKEGGNDTYTFTVTAGVKG